MIHFHFSPFCLVLQPFGKEAIGTSGVITISLLVSASSFGAANTTIFVSSRVIFSAAREGHAPECLSGVNVTTKTPIDSTLLQVD